MNGCVCVHVVWKYVGVGWSGGGGGRGPVADRGELFFKGMLGGGGRASAEGGAQVRALESS